MDIAGYVTLRNCQRAIIFFLFAGSILATVTTILRFVKNLIDKPLGSKYQEGGQKKAQQPKRQQSGEQMKVQKQIQKGTQITEDDTTFEKIIKALQQVNVYCMPFFIIFVWCLITGTSFAFCIVALFIIVIPMIMFNVIKIHRKCVQKKIVWALLEGIFLSLLILWFLNIWTIGLSTDPYYLTTLSV